MYLSLIYMWLSLTVHCGFTNKNIALNKPACMISEGSNNFNVSAATAVDGKSSTNIVSGTCCHSASSHHAPWWMVFLLDLYNIYHVVLHPASGVVPGNWLVNFTITTGTQINDKAELTGGELRLYHPAALDNGQQHRFNLTSGMPASFLRIQAFHKDTLGPLVLCEVELYGEKTDPDSPYGDMENIAVGKQTDQVSTVVPAAASRATDGNWDGEFSHQSCSHTNNHHHPWFIIDLGEPALITTVVISSRGSACCGSWMLGLSADVGLRRSEDNELSGVTRCLYSAGPGYNGQTYIGICPSGTIGRYIRVHSHPDTKLPLLLCEVGVFGMAIVTRLSQRQAVINLRGNFQLDNWRNLDCFLQCLADETCVAVNIDKQKDSCSLQTQMNGENKVQFTPLARKYFYQ